MILNIDTINSRLYRHFIQIMKKNGDENLIIYIDKINFQLFDIREFSIEAIHKNAMFFYRTIKSIENTKILNLPLKKHKLFNNLELQELNLPKKLNMIKFEFNSTKDLLFFIEKQSTFIKFVNSKKWKFNLKFSHNWPVEFIFGRVCGMWLRNIYYSEISFNSESLYPGFISYRHHIYSIKRFRESIFIFYQYFHNIYGNYYFCPYLLNRILKYTYQISRIEFVKKIRNSFLKLDKERK